MGIKRTLVRVGSFAFQFVISFALLGLSAVQAHPADILMGIMLGSCLMVGGVCAVNLAIKDLDDELLEERKEDKF